MPSCVPFFQGGDSLEGLQDFGGNDFIFHTPFEYPPNPIDLPVDPGAGVLLVNQSLPDGLE